MKSIDYLFHYIGKKLRIGFVPSSGRNFTGKICVHHRGGGTKKCLYKIDFYRRINCFGFLAKQFKISFYSSLIGLIIYENGLSSYILLSENLNINMKIFSGSLFNKDCLTIGSAIPLTNMKLFMIVNNIELYPFSGSSFARAAGVGAIITSKTPTTISLKSKSGWNIIVSNHCIGSIGSASNSLHKFLRIKKAGLVRALGIRPTVRGVAMNPCDHPHGGGEGKKSPPASALSPWGKLTKGTPTNIKKHLLLKKKLFKVYR